MLSCLPPAADTKDNAYFRVLKGRSSTIKPASFALYTSHNLSISILFLRFRRFSPNPVLVNMHLSSLIPLASLLATANSCTFCPHPSTFTGSRKGPLFRLECSFVHECTRYDKQSLKKAFESQDVRCCQHDMNIELW